VVVVVAVTVVFVDCVVVVVVVVNELGQPTPTQIPTATAITQMIITVIVTHTVIKQRIKIPLALRSAGCLGELFNGRLGLLVNGRLGRLVNGRLG
jgi:hypothetical protein